jgi:putative transposase
MMGFIEESRGSFGVEPICKALQFAPSTYYDRRAVARDPDRASARARSDAALNIKINAVWDANRKLYGARKIWHVLRRQGEDASRCTVERLMRSLGIRGVVRGKRVITTQPDTSQPCPDDKVNRMFTADRPNKLWVSDFTYVPTWSGIVYVAFVIDVFARRIVGWRASTSMKTQFVLDALDQAIWQRKTPDNKSLVHHSDRGSQYLSIKYTERLAEAEIDLSVGTVGDACDRASGRHWFKTTGEGPSRMRHWPVQNRGHQPDRPMEIDARSRMGNPEMGRLV